MVGKKSNNGNKKGSMLLLVLIILALGLILISSAMMMTSNTRKRYYNYSESSQARLTVTSVAETFWQALYMQEITDEQVLALANANATVTLSSSNLPGLSSASDNCTTVKFSSDAVAGYIYADFTTTIDQEKENVRITLKAPTPRKKNNLFASPVELEGGLRSGTQFRYNEIGFGRNGTNWKDDNWLYFFSDSEFANGGSTVYGNVFCQGTLKFNNNDNIEGDIVLYGPDSGVAGRSGNALNNSRSARMFFINSRTPIATSWNSGDVNLAGMAFLNTGSINSSMVGVLTGGTNRIPNMYSNTVGTLNYGDSQIVSALQAAAEGYNTPEFATEIQERRDQCYPGGGLTASTASDLFGIDVNVPAGAQQLNVAGQQQISLESNVVYRVTGNISNQDTHTLIKCDLSKGDYYIYVTGPTTCYAQFECINATGTSHNLYIMLAANASLTFAKPNGGAYSGIISTTHTGEFNNVDSFYSTLKQNNKPHAYIYGYSNSSVICMGQNYIEAFVGLYGQNGKIEFREDANTGFYGRIAASSLSSQGGNIKIPYCPDPNYDENPSDVKLPHYSEFEIVRFQYYYV